ncbi:MAG: hypothetical protein QM541_14400 [Flavobacterium sp.]|nr:hypothetical protein [Flavobacterium sp.]
MLQYFFTNFGIVYAGWRMDETNFPNYTVIIQSSKISEYNKLKLEDKTFEKIREYYGWILRNDVIKDIVNSDEFSPNKNHHQSDSCNRNHDCKVMFVFGAGASANCVYGNDKTIFDKDNLRPPLGPELFEKRFEDYYTKFKGVNQSLDFLQNDSNPDVEELFEKEWKNIERENNQEVLSRHINILYYLQEVLRDVSTKVIENYFSKNLYAKLADKLQKLYSSSVKTIEGITTSQKFAFVSFNQDTILEHFISEYFKKTINSMDDYVNLNDSPFCIFKPHGSYNWGWQFPDTTKFNGNTASWLFDNNINLFQLYYTLLGNRINMIGGSTWGHESQINKNQLGKYTIDKSQLKIIDSNNLNGYFPALLLPYRDKDEFMMPLRHFDNMRYCFSFVETLVIIGWKGNEDAFNRQLFQQGDKINKIVIVDPNSDVVTKNLEPLLTKNKINPIVYKSFEDFVTNGVEKELNL